MRYAVLACSLLAFAPACSPSVETTATPHPCVTSLACNDGERCDEGLCVPDADCPPALAPTVLYAPVGDEQNASYVLFDGREYWQGPTDFPTFDAAVTETWFVDLATKVRSTLQHPLGTGSCGFAPGKCMFFSEMAPVTVLDGVHLAPGATAWSAAASISLPAGYMPFGNDQQSSGDWLLWNVAKSELATWHPGDAAPEALIDFEGLSGVGGVYEAKGLPKSVVRQHNEPGTATLEVAPLSKGATFSPLFNLEGGFKFIMFPLPDGAGGWFVVHDVPGTASTYRVWHVDASGTKELGTSDDPILSVVGWTYLLGSPPLEGNSRGRGVFCANDTCRSAELDLATVTVNPLGSTTVPGTSLLSAVQTRWLSCNTAEVLAVELVPKGAGKSTKLYRMRIPASNAH